MVSCAEECVSRGQAEMGTQLIEILRTSTTTEVGMVSCVVDGRVSEVSHAISYCTNASRGLSTAADFLVYREC